VKVRIVFYPILQLNIGRIRFVQIPIYDRSAPNRPTFREDDLSGLGPLLRAIALHNGQPLHNTSAIVWHFFQGMGWQNLLCLVFAAVLIRIGIVGGEFRGLHTREPIPERRGRFWAFVTAALFLAFGLFGRKWH